MAKNNGYYRSNMDVTGMKDGKADTVVAIGKQINNYGPQEQVNVCSQCRRKIKKIENEGDDISSLIKKQKRLFTESRSFLEAKRKLEEKRVVVITGAPDEGKTTLAVQLCDTFMRQEYSGCYFMNIGKVVLNSIGSNKTVTIFDNMFEEFSFPEGGETCQILCKVQQQINKQDTMSVFIIVCQMFDMKRVELQKHGEELQKLLSNEHVVNISNINCSEEGERWRERYRVLQGMNSFLIEQEKMKIAQHTPFLIGFVGMCRFYDTANQISCITYPQAFYFHHFSAIMKRDPTKAGVFIFLIFCEGKIDFSKQSVPSMQSKLRAVNDIFTGITFDILQNEVSCLTGTYLECNQHGITEFTYPVLYDACVAAIIDIYPQYILEHCKIKFRDDDSTDTTFMRKENAAAEGTRDVNIDTNQANQENSIIIHKSSMNLIADLLTKMLKSREFCHTLKHPFLRNEKFRKALFDNLETDLPNLLEHNDIENGGNLLFWSADTGNKPLISRLLNLPELSTSEINQSIITCAERNSVSALENLDISVNKCSRKDLNFNVDFKIADKTPLMIASTHGHDAMVNRLLAMGADPSVADINGRTCVHLAAVSDDVDTFQTLRKHVPKAVLDCKDGNGFTPNMVAFAKKGAILEYQYPYSDPTGVTDSSEREENKEIQKLSELAMSSQDTEHIQSACLNDSEIEIRSGLLKGTLKINETCSNGNTPVMIAAYYGSQKIFKLLVKEKTCDVSVVNDYGCNILHNACIGGNVDIVQHIMQLTEQKLVDQNMQNRNGRTPVMEAAYMGHTLVFNLLVSKGCDISGEDCKGSTILHIACMGGNASIIKRILSLNIADIKSRNCDGKIPLEIASERGHDDVVKLLKSHDLQCKSGVLDRHQNQEAERNPLKVDAPTPSDERGAVEEEIRRRSAPPVPPKPKVVEGGQGESTKRKPPPVPPKPQGLKKRTVGAKNTERKLPHQPTSPQLPPTPPTPPTLPTSSTPSLPPSPPPQEQSTLPPTLPTSSTPSLSPSPSPQEPSPLPSTPVPSTSNPTPPSPGTDIRERQDGSENPSQTGRVKPDETVVEGPVYTITNIVSRASHQVSCPAMTLHRDRVHRMFDVSEDGQELVNWRESGHHSDQFQVYWGTCSRLPIPLPPSPSTLTAPTYWETDTRVQVKSEVPVWFPLLEMGVSEEGQVDTENLVGEQRRGWGVHVTRCDIHPGYCTQVWGERRQCGVCLTDTLTRTPGTEVSLKYGAVVDIGRGRLAFIDLNRGRVLHRFDVKIRESVRPMFGVSPFSHYCDVTMRLVSGGEITMDDRKQNLIAEALFGHGLRLHLSPWFGQ